MINNPYSENPYSSLSLEDFDSNYEASDENMDDEENVTNLMVQQNIRNNQTLNYDEAQVQSTLNEHQEAMETEPTTLTLIENISENTNLGIN